ncbi:MAG: 23S rRNA (guanosine(2251)-2'-O)-methyltransferase RlmB [Magnetococcales bacterium]|nr:23S rRNA (guanosine(2251)-2'-O)-methyltransferase RlmB [Magnetococcales bacterium]
MNGPTRLTGGFHAVAAALRNGAAGIEYLAVDRNRLDKRMEGLLQLARTMRVKIRLVERAELDELGQGLTHQGVVLLASPRITPQWDDFLPLLKEQPHPLLLLLDQVEDPRNLGAILRSAEVFGVSGVVVPRMHSAPLGPGAEKAAAGAASLVDLFKVSNLARTMEELKEAGFQIIGLAEEGSTSLPRSDLSGPLALVLGNEERGLRRLTREHCDTLVSIPNQGRMASLNVSVAAGIVLYEVMRQRLAPR